MEEWIPTLQRIVAAGLALLLVMLRLEAERFNAAEYDESKDGRPPSFRRRIAWYGVGFVLIAGILFIHPAARDGVLPRRRRGPGEDARLRLPLWHRRGGLRAGCRPLPIPPGPAAGRVVVPGRADQRGLDRAHRRGHVPRRDVRAAARDRPEPERREHHPGDRVHARDAARGAGPEPLHARDGAARRARRRVGHRRDRRDRGRVHRPLDHALRGLRHDRSRGQFLPRGREEEEIDKKRRPPDGWRVIGPREQASRDR